MINVTTLIAACALPTMGQGATPPPTAAAPNLQVRPRIVVAPPKPAQTEPPKPKLTLNLPPPLWGFADLHAHPASHMSFGANANGTGGIFWGKPGMKFGSSNPLADMPACNADSHYGFDEDFVRKETRKAVIQTLDSITGWTHGSNGGNSFANWPHAESLIHQQMHINSIRRAYDGGLRLMMASVTDSQMLSNLWTKIGFNAFGNSVPKPDPQYDFESAKRQLDFINQQAAANAGWMRIVTTSAEARKAIEENKLAIILSLEMDSLSADQILSLAKNYKVRQVIPIHLTDNSFGGTAVYNDVFNASSNYLNGGFYQVSTDPQLDVRLGHPMVLQSAEAGSIKPVPVNLVTALGLGYHLGTGGHKNKRGLNDAAFKRLLQAGLLVDVAHMSERATEEALRVAEQLKYPIMNSHSGLRDAHEHGHSERDLMRGHARRIAKLGGVLGLGTEGKSSNRELLSAKGSPLVRFTGERHEWSRPLPTAGGSVGKVMSKLRITIVTGDYDLRGGSDNVGVRLTLKSGKNLSFPNVNKSQTWGGDVRKTVDLPVPAGTKIGDVVSITLVTKFGGGIGGDNWNVDEVILNATEKDTDTVGTWLAEYKDAMAIMGHGNVALGTDINGFAPQIPFAASAVNYPLTVAQKTGIKPAGYVPPALAKFQMGARVYDFKRDGIAHFGMLPDFMQALSQQPGSATAVSGLYRSADAVVRMWEKVEAAAKTIK
ncbi:MAG TPA: membrane dipeptidase [Fimbriimonadaceae bacterium]|nr:membrane dipeptidase [Fimbriimonadaceae bacterium]